MYHTYIFYYEAVGLVEAFQQPYMRLVEAYQVIYASINMA